MHIDLAVKLIAKFLFSSFRQYFQLIENLFRITNPEYKRPKVLQDTIGQFVPEEIGKENIDRRIKKIDLARENLQDAIQAIGELHDQANENKAELEKALRHIADIEKQKHTVGKELAELKNVASADTEAFRRIVGLPTIEDIWRERFVGFFSGILASLIATGVVLLVTFLI